MQRDIEVRRREVRRGRTLGAAAVRERELCDKGACAGSPRIDTVQATEQTRSTQAPDSEERAGASAEVGSFHHEGSSFLPPLYTPEAQARALRS